MGTGSAAAAAGAAGRGAKTTASKRGSGIALCARQARQAWGAVSALTGAEAHSG